MFKSSSISNVFFGNGRTLICGAFPQMSAFNKSQNIWVIQRVRLTKHFLCESVVATNSEGEALLMLSKQKKWQQMCSRPSQRVRVQPKTQMLPLQNVISLSQRFFAFHFKLCKLKINQMLLKKHLARPSASFKLKTVIKKPTPPPSPI